jgi:hypothetical protein
VKFTIGILKRATYIHAQCFDDFAKALAAALRVLGHETVEFDASTGRPLGRLIAFGINNAIPIEGLDSSLPDDTIVFNTEQMTAFGGDVNKQMLNLERWKQHTILDYSRVNAESLRAAGAERVVHCPLGYIPSMQVIEPNAAKEDIDVLFYGSVNPRRAVILEALDRAGLKVVRLFGVYGAERDAVIARSKVVLNLHHYDKPIFEIFRCSHLFANRRCVVSEDGGVDEELEAFARTATSYASREALIDRCKTLVENKDLRDAQAARGFHEFSEISLVESVRKALELS